MHDSRNDDDDDDAKMLIMMMMWWCNGANYDDVLVRRRMKKKILMMMIYSSRARTAVYDNFKRFWELFIIWETIMMKIFIFRWFLTREYQISNQISMKGKVRICPNFLQSQFKDQTNKLKVNVQGFFPQLLSTPQVERISCNLWQWPMNILVTCVLRYL